MKEDITERVSAFSTEALLTCFALSLRKNHGFGYQRIFRDLQSVEDMMADILDGKLYIEDLKDKLREETGIVIKA